MITKQENTQHRALIKQIRDIENIDKPFRTLIKLIMVYALFGFLTTLIILK